MQRREKGTGTIIKTETGYKGKIDIGRGTDGKRKFKCFSGKTEAEVKRKIREYNKSGAPTNPQQILLKDYLMSWLVNIKRISLKPSSYDIQIIQCSGRTWIRLRIDSYTAIDNQISIVI